MRPRSISTPVLWAAVAVTAASLSLSGCSWYEDVTGQTTAQAPPQGAANFNNMMAAIDSEPQQAGKLSQLSGISPNDVIIANVDMMARGGSGRELDNAMHRNARSIEDLRHRVDQNAPLRQVLSQRHVPVNNVVALDVTHGGGVVVYALPTVQAGALPPPQYQDRPPNPNAPPSANPPQNADPPGTPQGNR